MWPRKMSKPVHKIKVLEGQAKSESDTSCHAALLSEGDGIRTRTKTAITVVPEPIQAKKRPQTLNIVDSDLLEVISSWSDLPDPIRIAVLAVARSGRRDARSSTAPVPWVSGDNYPVKEVQP